MGWRLAKSLGVLRDQINARWPTRSKESDGTVGDAAHAATTSDHNPNQYGVVTAMDITHDPAHGLDSGKLAESLRLNRDPRIKYVISNGRIFSSAVSPWQWRPYTGLNAHAKHVHISVMADPALCDSIAPWALNVGAVPTVSRFDECVAHVLRHEGGLSDHPSDPGGLTNMGITLVVFRENVPSGTADDLRKLTVAQAKSIYKRRYWDALNCERLPAGVDYAVFDFGVNSGIARAADFMTRIVAQNPQGIINELCDARLAYLQVIRHPKTGELLWTKFGNGWSRRVSEVRATAIKMAGAPRVEPAPAPAQPKPSPATIRTVQTGVGVGVFVGLWEWLGPVVALTVFAAVAAFVAYRIISKRRK